MSRLPSISSWLIIPGAIACWAGTSRAAVIWKGDFSTWDLSQWTIAETVASDRLTVVPDPLDPHRPVLRAVVEQGDNPIGASGNRNELLYEGDDVSSGSAERWYHWQTMWPNDFESANTWQLFTQWHQYNGGGSPPVEFFTWGEQVDLTILTQGDSPLWTVPLERGVWHDFVLHVKWSEDPSVGFIELTYDGKPVIPHHPCATLLSGGGGVYLKQGLYRDASISQTQTIYHTGMAIGTTEADVVPPPPPPPPAPAQTDGGTAAHSNPLSSAPSSASPPPSNAARQTGFTIAKAGGCDQADVGEAWPLLLVVLGFAWRRRSPWASAARIDC